jgi:hypothetical protein
MDLCVRCLLRQQQQGERIREEGEEENEFWRLFMNMKEKTAESAARENNNTKERGSRKKVEENTPADTSAATQRINP